MGKIVKVSGPLVVATGMQEANMADVVRVGEQRLIGEILTMSGDSAAIQVYEETSGLGPGAEVTTTGAPLSVELGPGLIENIYDGSSVRWRSSVLQRAATACRAALRSRRWTGKKSGTSSRLPASVTGLSAATSSAPCRKHRRSSTRSWCRRR